MSKKKILTIALCVALVAALVVGASIAYFTDTDNTVTNVLNIGNVHITLTEPNWDPDENLLMPGVPVAKDPTIHVEDDSQPCYLFVELTFNRWKPLAQYLRSKNAALMSGTPSQIGQAFTDAYFVGFENTKWEIMNGDAILADIAAEKEKLTIILGYQAIGGGDLVLTKDDDDVVVFTATQLPDDLTQDNAYEFWYYADHITPKEGPNNIDLTITAKAIQAAGFESRAEAYAALYAD